MDAIKETYDSDHEFEDENLATENLTNEGLKRLLERTRQRREMLNQKLGKTPEPLPRKRLLEENTSQNINNHTESKDEESPGKRQCLREDELKIKADTPAISSVKSRMQQIVDNREQSGLAGTDKVDRVSSSESETSPQKPPGSRRGRFAMLAQNINSWEDDLSHPCIHKEEEKKTRWQPPKKETEKAEKTEIEDRKPASPVKTLSHKSAASPVKTFSHKSAASPVKTFSHKSSASPVKQFSPEKNVYSPVTMHNKGMAPEPPPVPAVLSSASNPSPVKHVSSHTLILGKSTDKQNAGQQDLLLEVNKQDPTDKPVGDRLASWKKADTPKKEKPVEPSEAPMSSKLAAWEKRVSNTPTKIATTARISQPLRQVATTPVADKPPLPKPVSNQAKPAVEKEADVDKNTDPASLPVSSRMATWQQRVAKTEPQKEEEPTAYSVTARMSAWEDMSSANKVAHIKKVDPSKTSPTKSPLRPVSVTGGQSQMLKSKPLTPSKSLKDCIVEKSCELKSTPLKNNTPIKLQPAASPAGKVGSATKMMQQKLIQQTQHSKTDDVADKLRQDRMAELKAIQNRWQNGILKDDSNTAANKQVETENTNCDTDRREAIKAKARADDSASYNFDGEQKKFENLSSSTIQGPPKPPHASKPPSSIYRLISQKKSENERPHMKRSESAKKVQFEEEDDSFDSTESEDLKLHPQGIWESETTTDDLDTDHTQEETTTQEEEETTTQDEETFDDTDNEVQLRKDHVPQLAQKPAMFMEYDSDPDDVSLSAFVPASVRRQSILPSPPQQEHQNSNISGTPCHNSKRPVSHPVASVPTKVRTQSTTNLRSLAQDSSSSLSSEDSVSSSQSSLDDPQQYDRRRYSVTDEEGDESEEDINDFLDEAIEEGEHYANEVGKPPVAAPRKRKSMAIATEDNSLVYSVSMYRSKKYSKNAPSPASKIRRNREFLQEPEEEDIEMPTQLPPDVERKSIKERIQELLELVNQEQSVIMQTSNALNQCCHSNSSFAGSAEQVECNRLLLLACQKRQAYLTEVQRLKDTGQLDPPGSGPKGSLTLSDIRLPLKKEFVTKIGTATDNTVHYFLILIRNNSQVIATQMLSTHDPMMKGSLDFPNLIKIHGISGSFKLNMEIYSMSVSKEYSDKNKKRKTPKKAVKSSIMPLQSPGGPSAVRTTNFTLMTSLPITMRCLDKSSFSLERIPYLSPLHGTIYMRLKCLMEQNIEERGFLTMFEDVSGLGAWHRRWCVLAGNKLCYWKYPDDETRKEPMGFIDLKRCITEKVGLIPRDICARPNTFELITVRQPRKGEQDTLVTRTYNTMTTTKHNLSADTKEERIVWCNKVNRALANIRTWHSDAMRPVKIGTIRK